MSVYALTDLHGRKDLWEIANQQLFQSHDTIYFLGDAIDRGPDGYELMNTLLTDPRVIYLKGNHEDMLANAINDYIDNRDIGGCNLQAYFYNEGWTTWADWQNAGEPNIAPILNALPESKTYINQYGQKIFLSHAGCNPWQKSPNLLWDRNHCLTRYWRNNSIADIIVHGHTPIPYLCGFYTRDDAYWYCINHKVDLDSYACTTGIATILDLDTLEAHIIKGSPVFYDYNAWED